MNWMINEVQITCFLLMALSCFVLGVVIPIFIQEDEQVKKARKSLVIATMLVMVHYVIQYYLHKTDQVIPEIRTVINLLFGIPMGFCFNFPLLYLQRKGKIKQWEYLSIPIAFCLALSILLAQMLSEQPLYSLRSATIMMSIIYGSTLLIYYIAQLNEYKRIKEAIKSGTDLSQATLLRWTELCMFLMIATGVTLPFMTFHTNLILRAIWGVVTISITFLYIFNFIGYDFMSFRLQGLKAKRKTVSTKKEDEDTEAEEKLSEEKLAYIEETAARFVENRYYLKAGITIKDVADEMGISRGMLNDWLQTTEYKKFNNWLMILRIEEAKRLLKIHPNWSNETIAKTCGFCDRSYFQRQFSEVVGTPPSKWAKEVASENEEATPDHHEETN